VQGKHDPQLSFFDLVYDRIPQDHPLRQMKEVLDFSFVGELVAETYGTCGRPSHDPQVLFRMLFLAFLGNWSDRQCEEQIKYNLAARWFVGLSLDEHVPDHTALCRFRERLGPERMAEIFQRLVEQMDEAGLLKRSVQILDSTPIQADVDESGLDWDLWDGQGPVGGSSDPDARFGRRGKGKEGGFFGYKQHMAMEADTRLITKVVVTAGNVNDAEVLGQLVDGAARAVVADRGYDTNANHELVAQLGQEDGICFRCGEGRAGWVRRQVDLELSRQRWQIEPKFAEQVRRHGLRRARYRGLGKVTFQALMVALVVNVKRLVKLLAELGLLGRLRFGPCLRWASAAA